ncbi:MAG TPA: PfkB family carbohydrate kinase [Acidimicrobiales bacterium]|nr:PfkB family carbohydrate kinase [Acidimicrobiales bacterium]
MSEPAGPEVLVVGDLMVDVVVVPSGPLNHASDVASTIEMRGGGSAANTACWLGAAGRAVRLVAMVGDDAAAPGALALLESCGVRFAGAAVAGSATGTCVVLVDPDGERTMLPDRAANDRLDPDLVVAAVEDRPAWLHLSGYTLLDEGSRPAARAGLDRARALGVPVSVDASSAGPLRQLGGERFLEWVDGSRVLFANDDEVAALGGLDACRRHVEVVVAKHGPRGVSWVSADATVSVPAAPTTVVDTVGAGDALDAGVIDALVGGAGPEEALRAGAALAARAVARVGARP